MRSAGIARPVGERTPGTGGAGLSGPAVRRGGGAFGAEPGTRLSRRVRGLTAGAGAHVSRGDGAVPGTARLRRCRVPPARPAQPAVSARSEEHTSELQSLTNLVCRLLLEKKN